MTAFRAMLFLDRTQGAETRTKNHTRYTFGLQYACLGAPRNTTSLTIETLFATNDKRKGCEGLREAQAKFGEAERAVANAEPVAARSEQAKLAKDSQKTRAERNPGRHALHRTCSACRPGLGAATTYQTYDAHGAIAQSGRDHRRRDATQTERTRRKETTILRETGRSV